MSLAGNDVLLSVRGEGRNVSQFLPKDADSPPEKRPGGLALPPTQVLMSKQSASCFLEAWPPEPQGCLCLV